MSWKPEAEEIRQRHRWAEELGGDESVRRHHQQGRLTVRERIATLTDPGSFQEVGKLTGNATYRDGKPLKVVPAPYVMGIARIDGRPVAVGGEDFTIRGGTSWGSARRKGGQGGFIEDLACNYRIPLVNLIDGAGGTVTSAKRRGYSVFPGIHGFERSVELLGIAPVVSLT
jgi:acetyl-CoA carboxylase carboxyltransferase component